MPDIIIGLLLVGLGLGVWLGTALNVRDLKKGVRK